MMSIKLIGGRKLINASLALVLAGLLGGCMSTNPTLGGSSGNTVTGGAGGANAEGNNNALERCDAPLGTMSVFEDQNEAWWYTYRNHYPNLGSTLPVLRTMIQQSNCFVIVERGRTMSAMTAERELMNSGELRDGSNFGKGQLVAADYTMQPSIQFSEKTGGMGGLIGGWVGAVAGGARSNEAATTLLLIDNRSGVQVSSSVGNAKNWDFSLFGGAWFGMFAGAGGFSDTPEGKVITAAFADSYNHMVKSLRNYKAQNVEGGLGKGGKLTVN
ncbi:CsgG/HfaB family protein [Bowmanella denitrificans]|uniref:CsgG/HfaB family protein n=1 Tax=Bowmanella denitrificans TaxID=366582 RepID=UPI001C0EF1BE|nr:CsgG/HfaB family protein [Bowmanella denitrificans]